MVQAVPKLRLGKYTVKPKAAKKSTEEPEKLPEDAPEKPARHSRVRANFVRHCIRQCRTKRSPNLPADTLFGTVVHSVRHCRALCSALWFTVFGTVMSLHVLFGTVIHCVRHCCSLCSALFSACMCCSALLFTLFGTVVHSVRHCNSLNSALL